MVQYVLNIIPCTVAQGDRRWPHRGAVSRQVLDGEHQLDEERTWSPCCCVNVLETFASGHFRCMWEGARFGGHVYLEGLTSARGVFLRGVMCAESSDNSCVTADCCPSMNEVA